MGDTGSVHRYRSNAGQTSASASGSVKSGYAPIEVHACLDGDDLGGARSSSPVSNISLSGDEVTLPGLVSLRRSARRARFGSSAQTTSDSEGDHGQVRFDDHVSYIDRTTADVDAPGLRSPQDSPST